ncbi:MAG: hypothetical protein MUF05_00005, partial [Candidatus Omnitrophica bacterium]|nr:hypothetical protein [Candidatus Omnitrophota bacterium]
FPVFLQGISKKTILYALVMVLAVALGISYYTLTTKKFCTAEANQFFAMRIWSQVSGGTGPLQSLSDKNIAVAFIDGAPPEQMVKIIYKRAGEAFRENPLRILRAIKLSYQFLFRGLNFPFSKDKIANILFSIGIFFIMFFMFFEAKDKNPGNIKRGILLILLLALICANNEITPLILSGIGLLYILFYGTKPQRLFIILYFAGIGTSLILNGGGGYEREWLSLELLLYYLCASGIYALVQSPPPTITQKPMLWAENKAIKQIALLFVFLLLIFIIIPVSLRNMRPNGYPLYAKIQITSADIQIKSKNKLPILSPEELKVFLLLWPKPSYEKLNGVYAYIILRPYRSYHLVHLKANEGISYDPDTFWPLRETKFTRMVYIEDRLIFQKEAERLLLDLEGKEIIVLGRLLGRERKYFTSTGYAIVAEYIGYQDCFGKILWAKVGSFT